MKKLSILIILCSLSFSAVRAQGGIGDIDYGMYDTIVQLNGRSYQIRRIPGVDFEKLRDFHRPKCLVRGYVGFEDIEKALGSGCEMVYETYEYGMGIILYEIRMGDRLTIYFDPTETGGPMCYYPDFGILGYTGGHESDQAVNLLTGESDDSPAVVSPDKKYLLTAMHSGQDDESYQIKMLDPLTGSYTQVANLKEVIRQIPEAWDRVGDIMYINDPFWVGNKLYFKGDGRRYVSVTIL